MSVVINWWYQVFQCALLMHLGRILTVFLTSRNILRHIFMTSVPHCVMFQVQIVNRFSIINCFGMSIIRDNLGEKIKQVQGQQKLISHKFGTFRALEINFKLFRKQLESVNL